MSAKNTLRSVMILPPKELPGFQRSVLSMIAGIAILTNVFAALSFGQSKSLPNIVVILADDLGYGDVSAINPQSKIPTRHIDRIAREGMTFTDAHTSSSVCSPTRYGLLTGRYNWRTRLQNGVLWGLSLPLIAPDRLTIGGLLQQQGYHTAAVGKWHLGLQWQDQQGQVIEDSDRWDPKFKGGERVDFTRPIEQGPITRGFDYFFGITASLDMPPYVYIENDRPIVNRLVKKGFNRQGVADEQFEAVDVLPKLTEKAVAYLTRRAAHPEQPFFLYLPLTAPHTPIVPTKPWRGKSGLNPYGDFMLQVDDTVGQVLSALDRLKLTDNTIFIFTSDNGCSPAAKIPQLQAKGHYPNYIYRGHKADIFDGGHRVPFLVRWPGKVEPASRSDQLVCLTDILGTVSEITGHKLNSKTGEDSYSFLSNLVGKSSPSGRTSVVHHSINGSFAIREGKWKLNLCPGSGGGSPPRPGRNNLKDLPPVQLYDMQADPSEKINVYDQHPEIVKGLRTKLEKLVASGRSTPGSVQTNDAKIELIKNRNPR